DSRVGTGGFSTPWGPLTVRDVTVAGVVGVPVDADAVVMNVTATSTTAASHLTIAPAGQSLPLSSNLNWPAGDTRANLVVVRVGTGGKVAVANNDGSVDVVADVVGWFDDGADGGDRYVGLSPA